jgi:hypothetical protein
MSKPKARRLQVHDGGVLVTRTLGLDDVVSEALLAHPLLMGGQLARCNQLGDSQTLNARVSLGHLQGADIALPLLTADLAALSRKQGYPAMQRALIGREALLQAAMDIVGTPLKALLPLFVRESLRQPPRNRSQRQRDEQNDPCGGRARQPGLNCIGRCRGIGRFR